MLVLLGGCVFSAPTWKGPRTPHFDGTRFVNLEPRVREREGGFLRWMLERQRGPWVGADEAPHGPPPPRRVGPGELRVTFINHATVLLQLDGVNVLTDPIYSDRCSPVSFVGPHRVRPPGVRFEDLPPIHAVVLSHNHYDHLDVATLRRLQHAWPDLRIFAGLGNRAFLAGEGVRNVMELDWWQEAPLRDGVAVASARSQHFSNRGLLDRDGTLWSAWVLKSPHGVTYFAGDTGWGSHFREARERFGAPRLAVLPIGAYKPEWFMAPVHISPKEAVQAGAELGAGVAVPMHYGTFRLADDGEREPVEALQAALAEPGAAGGAAWWVLGFGEGRDVPPRATAAARD